MKKSIKRVLTGAFATMLALGAVGCATPAGPGGGTSVEATDSTRTQLYVFNFDGGYGSEWLAKAKARYEALHAEDVYEEGKKGVQIVVTNTKTTREGAAIRHNNEEVYFTESIQYYQSINDKAFADITAAVTGENPYETGKTIESKLTAEQKSFYGYPGENGTVYYGIPHYSGSFGLVYDIDMFDANGYYLLDGYNAAGPLSECFIYDPTDKKTAGPDGEYDTNDDGLPATYDEFYLLCDYIASMGNTPIVWSGEHYEEYLTMLYNQVVVNQEGLEQALLTFTMDGTAENLGTVDANGNFVKDTEDIEITPDNAYELYRAEGKYEGLKFLEKLLTTAKYQTDKAFTSTHSHTQAQDDFLWSGKDGQTKPIAMLADGIWWQAEANETFNAMSKQEASWSKDGRNFGWMPLPRTADKVGQKNVYFDHLYSMAFIKANIAEWKLPLAIDFLQFVNTDESLVEFTQTTNTPKALTYEMDDEQLAELTPFGRSLLEFKQNADELYPLSTEPKFLNNQASFKAASAYMSKVGSLNAGFPSQNMHESGTSAATYFKGMYTYYQSTWKDLK